MHHEEGERRRPTHQQYPIQGFDADQQPQWAYGINVAEAERTEGLCRKIEVIHERALPRAGKVTDIDDDVGEPDSERIEADLA